VFEFSLTGLRGDNPLGFLAALGALVTLEDAGHDARLAWDGARPRLASNPHWPTTQIPETDQQRRKALTALLHHSLRRERGAGADNTKRAEDAMDRAKTACRKKADEIKKRKLGRGAANEARRKELEPLEKDLREKTAAFKDLFTRNGADPCVTLGKNLTASSAEFIAHVVTAQRLCRRDARRQVDLAAAYGVSDPTDPGDRMLASPWALVNGSGHQDFLGTVEELMVHCTTEHLSQALFGPWEPQDEKYSLRLDPSDDRRYSLMDRDPTASGNKTLTVWGANRLAFEALRFFPAMPVRGGMGICAWRKTEGKWQEHCAVRWPLWSRPVTAQVIHSLLGLRDIWSEEPDARPRLRGLGVHAVMESRRIAVGEGANRKFNLTPATPVWADVDVEDSD